MSEMKYEKYIVTDLIIPEEKQKEAAEYAKKATRILWLDSDVVKGAFQINCSWYWKANATTATAHTHDYDEVIGFMGGNPQDPHNLYGEVEFWLEDEKYLLTKSCLIFVPKGLKHCPLKVIKVSKPILHFNIVTGGKYIAKEINA